MNKSQKSKEQQFFDSTDEGKKEAIIFFDNKAAPKYWQVIYDVLMYRSKAFFTTIVVCSFIFTLPSIIEPIATHITPIIQQQAQKNEIIKNKINEDKKKLLSSLDPQKFREEVQSIREPYDQAYSQAQPLFNTLSSFSSELSNIERRHAQFNNEFQERFKNVFKTIAVLEAKTESAYDTISLEQILDAIQVLREEKINNFSKRHKAYDDLIQLIVKHQK